MPTLDDPVTDVERLIEVHLRAELDLYADLPDGVLGLTDFPARGAPKVLIDSALTEARDAEHAPAGVVGRWRATLAHEAPTSSCTAICLIPKWPSWRAIVAVANPSEAGLMRCLHRDISPTVAEWNSERRRPDWREVQANRAMAALLMPRRIFRRLAHTRNARTWLWLAASRGAPNRVACRNARRASTGVETGRRHTARFRKLGCAGLADQRRR